MRLTGYDAGAGETVAGGPYAITQGTVTNGNNPNYTITFAGANLTIDQRPIAVTADAQTKVYGDADPALTYQVTTVSLVGADILGGNLHPRVAGESVAIYPILQGTLGNPNYAIAYVGNILTIIERPITLTTVSAPSSQTPANLYSYGNPSLNYLNTSQNCTAEAIWQQLFQTGSAIVFNGAGVGCREQ